MISRTLALFLMTLTLMSAGCAAGFRAGGDRGGAGAGVIVAPPAPPGP